MIVKIKVKSIPHLLTSLKNIDHISCEQMCVYIYIYIYIYIYLYAIHLQQDMQISFAKLGFASGNIFIFIWFISVIINWINLFIFYISAELPKTYLPDCMLSSRHVRVSE